MTNAEKEHYWQSIPVGEENAIEYPALCLRWGTNERTVRRILHELSKGDNQDNYILIRSGHGKGFYRTDDIPTILAYKRECLSKGRSIFAPIKKINRVLDSFDDKQADIFNNLKATRVSLGYKQEEVCKFMKQYDSRFDASVLSKLENGVFLPTPYQLSKLARFYGVQPHELIALDLDTLDLYAAN